MSVVKDALVHVRSRWEDRSTLEKSLLIAVLFGFIAVLVLAILVATAFAGGRNSYTQENYYYNLRQISSSNPPDSNSPISTQVIDVQSGQPVPGLKVTLFLRMGDTFQELAMKRTAGDGRIQGLLASKQFPMGTYKLAFGVESFFKEMGYASIWSEIDVFVKVDRNDEQYHLILYLSPYGYSVYRGG